MHHPVSMKPTVFIYLFKKIQTQLGAHLYEKQYHREEFGKKSVQALFKVPFKHLPSTTKWNQRKHTSVWAVAGRETTTFLSAKGLPTELQALSVSHS